MANTLCVPPVQRWVSLLPSVCVCGHINQKFLYADAANFRPEWKWCVVPPPLHSPLSTWLLSPGATGHSRRMLPLHAAFLGSEFSFSNIHTFSPSRTLDIFSPFDISEVVARASSMWQLLHYRQKHTSTRAQKHTSRQQNYSSPGGGVIEVMATEINAKFAHFNFKMHFDWEFMALSRTESKLF